MRQRQSRRRGGFGAPPSTAQLSMRINGLERRLTGFKTTPQDNPPAFVQLPWNSFTYERTDTISDPNLLTSTVTVQDIIIQIANKCALSTNPPTVANVRVKVQGCQVWMTVGATLLVPDMEVRFFELSGETAANQQVRSTQRDLGTLNRPAKVGYQFPSADRREVIAEAAVQLKVVETTAVEVGGNITSRVQVLWQSSP